MNAAQLEKQPEGSAALTRSFELLKGYKAGSPRSDLTPIDDAVQAAMTDDSLRKSTEQKLLAALKQNLSPEATDYICSKLALIGSESSAAVLAPLLSDPPVSTPVRNALEKIPGPAVSRLLRQSCLALKGQQQLEVIQSIGERRDPLAVSFLRKLLLERDPAAVSAAACALGRIGNLQAAAALRELLPHIQLSVRNQAADAALVCAERLAELGQTSPAKALCHVLNATPFPAHIRKAALTLSRRLEKN